MQGQDHSYLDLSVLPELSMCVLSQDAVVVFRRDMERIIWANAAGARLFGGRGVVDLLAATLSQTQSIVRQINDTIEQMGDQESIIRGFRVNQGLRSLLLQFEIKRISLPHEDYGYKVSNIADMPTGYTENELANHAVQTLMGFADAAAILDDYGLPLAVSPNFQDIAPSEKVLANLVNELKDEDDQLIKRPERNLADRLVAVGLARLTENPGRNLIVLAAAEDEAQPVEETAEPESAEILIDESTSVIDEDTPISPLPNEEGEDSAEVVATDTEEASNEIPQFAESQNEEIGIEESEKRPLEIPSNESAVRFAWTTDENTVFQSVSPELAETVGFNAAAIVGRSWRDVANVLGFDRDGEIQDLLMRHDTWSGKSVFWPVEGTDKLMPVDLAALPAFNSDREFSGFRGFGVIHSDSAISDPEEIGLALDSGIPESTKEENPDFAETEISESAKTEFPEIEDSDFTESQNPEIENQDSAESDSAFDENQEVENHSSSNIVRLVPKDMQPAPATLSERESTAFQKIGDTLRSESEERAPGLREETRIEKAPQTDTSLMEMLPVAILIYRSEELLFANESFLNATGYASLEELAEAGGIEAVLDPAAIENEEESQTFLVKSKGGKPLSANPVLKTVPWSGDKALLLSFAPNLELDEEVALEITSASEIQNILDTTTDGILLLEDDGTVISINASAEALFGRSFSEAAGENIALLFAPESRTSIRQYMESLSAPGVKSLMNDGLDVIATESGGGAIPIFLTISKMDSTGKLCAVVRDMTSWKKVEEDLINSRREAEKANEQKSEFLAHVSHEIRTPLNAIIGFSDVMIEERFGPIDNERYREYLRDINRSGNHVLELINDLLDLSKIEAGKLELAFEAVDLNQVVAETVALLQPQANGNRIIIRTSLSRAVPKVVADTRSIRQIILNLVSNAIKFSPANSQVIVSTVYESNGEVALRVRDTGEGMTAAEINDAMKPFHQVHGVSEKSSEGSGLGLPLTKALIEANRALFDLESEPGRGTIAHMQFPTQRVLAD